MKLRAWGIESKFNMQIQINYIHITTRILKDFLIVGNLKKTLIRGIQAKDITTTNLTVVHSMSQIEDIKIESVPDKKYSNEYLKFKKIGTLRALYFHLLNAMIIICGLLHAKS